MVSIGSDCYSGGRLCSLVSEAQGEDPIATAGAYERYLILEVALPWDRPMVASRHVPRSLRELLDRASERGRPVRFQAIVPDRAYTPAGSTRVIWQRKPAGLFAAYDRDEFVVPPSDVTALVAALIEEEPSALERFARYRDDRAGSRDLLVCTHGAHDVCCGRFGYPVYAALRYDYAPALAGEVRVWRTSHLGGHRFAPTLLDLPTMHYWGRLDPERAESILLRRGSVAALRGCYRGWGGVAKPVQVAEREIFIAEGWRWAGYHRRGAVVAADAEAGRWDVRLSFASPDGSVEGRYEATVEVAGTVSTLASSGTGPMREEAQYRVSRLDLVGPSAAAAG